jgi:hypothetical protein
MLNRDYTVHTSTPLYDNSTPDYNHIVDVARVLTALLLA